VNLFVARKFLDIVLTCFNFLCLCAFSNWTVHPSVRLSVRDYPQKQVLFFLSSVCTNCAICLNDWWSGHHWIYITFILTTKSYVNMSKHSVLQRLYLLVKSYHERVCADEPTTIIFLLTGQYNFLSLIQFWFTF
jgi:hypothetical protein